MNTEIELKLTLRPTIEKDEKTNLYMGWFEEFPQAIAVGEDISDLNVKLIEAFTILMEVRKEDVIEKIVNSNKNTFSQINLNSSLVTI